MSYYEAQSWQLPTQQASWEQPPPPSRAGTPTPTAPAPRTQAYEHAGTNSVSQHEDVAAFDIQIEGVSWGVESFSFRIGFRVLWCEPLQKSVPSIHVDHDVLYIVTDTWSTEVNRALDNLNKSGKLFSPSSRRESMPMMGGPRAFSDFGAYNVIPVDLDVLITSYRPSYRRNVPATSLHRRFRSDPPPCWLEPPELLRKSATPAKTE